MKWIKIIVIFLAAVLAYYVVRMLTEEKEEREYKTKTARIKSIEQMVDLCTLDVHEEVPVKDSINGKWIVARQTIDGRVRFDLDSLKIEERGDTTVVYLPPERWMCWKTPLPPLMRFTIHGMRRTVCLEGL